MKKLEIVVNKRGQRILIVTEAHNSVYIDHSHLKYDDFDAVMYASSNGNLLSHQFFQLSPITRPTFYLKPFFVHPLVRNSTYLKGASDGLFTDVNDEALISKIDEIKQTFEALNMEVQLDKLKDDEHDIMVSIFRFFILRGGMPRPKLRVGTSSGYSVGLIEYYLRFHSLSWKTMMAVYEYGLERRYLESIEDMDRIHFCKKCFATHLIHTAICPKCSSHRIEEVSMLHHYPCANISVESTYMKDGLLVCPKCRKRLRHIGVDYDRPMGVYNCHDCYISFSQSKIRVTCTKCANVTALQELGSSDVHHYCFTNLGIEMLSNWSCYDLEAGQAICPGFSAMGDFKKYLACKIEACELCPSNQLSVIRVKGISQSNAISYSQFIYQSFPNTLCTFLNNTIYLAVVYRDGSESYIENTTRTLDIQINNLKTIDYMGADYIEYEGDGFESYVQRVM